MVIKLNSSHNNILKDFIYSEKDWNLFMIGDYENYGIETDFQYFWGELDENDCLIAVLMKYYEGLIFSAVSDKFDIDSFIKIINSLNYKVLSGKQDVLKKFADRINFSSIKDTYYSKLDDDSKVLNNEFQKYNIINCLETDTDYLKEVVIMTNAIDEFSVDTSYDRILNSIRDKSGRVYAFINEENKVVSAAQITAENSSSAMVVAVCTNKDHRGKGYASKTLSKLCNDLLKDNKVLCLFYDNPVAGNIYKRIGFKDIGKWSMFVV